MEKMIYSRRCDGCVYAVRLELMRPSFDGEEPTYCCLLNAIDKYGDGVAVEVMPYDSCDSHVTLDELVEQSEV